MKATPSVKRDTKWIFFKKGTCSQTMFYILNREFGNPMEAEERATDPMAGGILRQGYQCGFLWGAAMAVGAEAHHRTDSGDKAIGLAMKATEKIVESFRKRAGTTECYDITDTSWLRAGDIAKYFVKGKMVTCFKLADKWAPEAIQAAKEGLDQDITDLPEKPMSCASEVVRKMGGSEKEMSIAAGLAGGIGMSGSGCGALAAAIWKNTIEWCRDNPGKSGYNNPRANQTMDTFLKTTDYELECSKICGRAFNIIDEHTSFIKNGGCKEIIDKLAEA
jgi:C_GCAxxG_C_C family probable redox protein